MSDKKETAPKLVGRDASVSLEVNVSPEFTIGWNIDAFVCAQQSTLQ